MADAPKAVKIEAYGTASDGRQRRFAVADANAISKGTILSFSDLADAVTASKALKAEAAAGVAAIDKEALDGGLTISVWTDVVVDVRASGAITAGNAVVTAGNDEVMDAFAASPTTSHSLIVTRRIFGYAEQTASDAEIIRIRINL